MADNVPLPAAAGRVATDEVAYSGDSDAAVQLVRLVRTTGAEGSKTVVEIPVTADGLERVAAHRDVARISVASAGLTTATTAYTAGDQLGSLFTLPNAARATGGTGTVVGVTLIDAADVIGACDVVFFRDTVTLAADNAAFAISDTDALNVVAVVPLAGHYDVGNNRIAQAFNLAVPYDCAATSLFAALITRSGHTFFGAVGNLQLVVHVERN